MRVMMVVSFSRRYFARPSMRRCVISCCSACAFGQAGAVCRHASNALCEPPSIKPVIRMRFAPKYDRRRHRALLYGYAAGYANDGFRSKRRASNAQRELPMATINSASA